MNLFPSLSAAIRATRNYLLHTGNLATTETWQGKPLNADQAFWEALHWSFSAPIPQDTLVLQKQILPNLPWADNQFSERVEGEPVNPGRSYKEWPFYKDDGAKFRDNDKFTHTYMERFWPKYGGDKYKPFLTNPRGHFPPHSGLRFEYGDYNDVVNLLKREPNTRQAYLPIWFPEDTGVNFKGRVPCTLGYWFINRLGQLDIEYYIRACDYFRHFRDDVYMACLLVIHTLYQLRQENKYWEKIKPGSITMHIGSLHIFAAERIRLSNEKE